jgi:hypothetical protein
MAGRKTLKPWQLNTLLDVGEPRRANRRGLVATSRQVETDRPREPTTSLQSYVGSVTKTRLRTFCMRARTASGARRYRRESGFWWNGRLSATVTGLVGACGGLRHSYLPEQRCSAGLAKANASVCRLVSPIASTYLCPLFGFAMLTTIWTSGAGHGTTSTCTRRWGTSSPHS